MSAHNSPEASVLFPQNKINSALISPTNGNYLTTININKIVIAKLPTNCQSDISRRGFGGLLHLARGHRVKFAIFRAIEQTGWLNLAEFNLFIALSMIMPTASGVFFVYCMFLCR